jgi:hypothetical protein
MWNHQLEWDEENPLVLHVVDVNDVYTRFECSLGIYQHDGVVDGKSLLLTPFHKVNTPPPMSHSTISFPSTIRHISFFGQSVTVLFVI